LGLPKAAVDPTEVLDHRAADAVRAGAELAFRQGSALTMIAAYRRPFWWADATAGLMGLPVVDSRNLLRREISALARPLDDELTFAWIPDRRRVREVVKALLGEGRFGSIIIVGKHGSRGNRRLSDYLSETAVGYGASELHPLPDQRVDHREEPFGGGPPRGRPR
jgi:hypothetical protein